MIIKCVICSGDILYTLILTVLSKSKQELYVYDLSVSLDIINMIRTCKYKHPGATDKKLLIKNAVSTNRDVPGNRD